MTIMLIIVTNQTILYYYFKGEKYEKSNKFDVVIHYAA